MEFEKYVKYDSGSHKILAAIIFDCNFKSSSDPLPLQVTTYTRRIKGLLATTFKKRKSAGKRCLGFWKKLKHYSI
ncbi:phospholipid-transporting ATPase ABCA3-like [Leopardus geoffroyi]|uniref:phospholipid-transporting ATPase ABCA3-like n=1 Tax=Leopardus geoffroyi TaxID=46844 RepID=UPI001E25D71A|nr:phospholipid-transporting ATPase ABCA3-like [Leopardus geoffroyi]